MKIRNIRVIISRGKLIWIIDWKYVALREIEGTTKIAITLINRPIGKHMIEILFEGEDNVRSIIIKENYSSLVEIEWNS